ncbi:MAG: RDD family protein [Trebonia sp.]
MNSRAREPEWIGAQGQYAGAASRFVAYAVDIIVGWSLFTLALAGVSFAIKIVTGRSVMWHLGSSIAVAVVFAVWELSYFGYCWAAVGKTPGMTLLGVRVVRADGADIDPWRGVVRALAFPLSVVSLGLGFIGILTQREHRALHDLIAGTAVVYAWDARAARLRFLSRAHRNPHPDPGDAVGRASPKPGLRASAGQEPAPLPASATLPRASGRSTGDVS